MSRTIRELYERAAELQAAERAELAALLLESLEPEDDVAADLEAAWAEEIQRRVSDYHAGRAETLSWDEVRASLHRPDR
jgi:putative addiction module component (TIGR02574 family)